MKLLYIAATALCLIAGTAYSDTADPALKPICLLTGSPPSDIQYKVVRKVKASLHGYGSVNEIIPILITKARRYNADAVIEYNGSQRFGFWPWQVVRPVATGVAVNWRSPDTVDCKGIGGTFETHLKGPKTTDT